MTFIFTECGMQCIYITSQRFTDHPLCAAESATLYKLYPVYVCFGRLCTGDTEHVATTNKQRHDVCTFREFATSYCIMGISLKTGDLLSIVLHLQLFVSKMRFLWVYCTGPVAGLACSFVFFCFHAVHGRR